MSFFLSQVLNFQQGFSLSSRCSDTHFYFLLDRPKSYVILKGMFIRKVTKTNGKTKKQYEYLHLIESVRTEEGPRHRLILNLGNLDIHPSQYKALARRIEDILTGQQSFVEVEERVEKYAQQASQKIFQKRAEYVKEEQPSEFGEVDVTSLEAESCRSLGPEYLCNSIWEELGIDGFLLDKGVSDHVLPLIKALVVGRMVCPGSERATKEWAENRSALYELCGFPLRNSLNSYYRAGDHLLSAKEGLEKHLTSRERDLFSLKEKMIFLDLTNTYFEGLALQNPKALRGHSKEKRSDCKLVTLVIVDENGFSKHSEIFAGNQSEPRTLKEMVTALEIASSNKKDRTVVIDAGLSTEANITWLKEEGYHYLTVHRGKGPVELEYEGFDVIKEDPRGGTKIEVKRFQAEEELYLLCRSTLKEHKEKGMGQRVEDLFIERLCYYKEGLSRSGRTKKYNKILQLIGRLKEKYPGAARLYEVEVVPEKGKKAEDPGVLAVDIIWKKKQAFYREKILSEGTYLLRTDRLDLSDKEIWEIYVMLNQVESAFRSLKSDLGLRPNFHQIESRVDSHLFISVIAYHLLHVIEYRLRRGGDTRKWRTICNVLSTHQRLTISYLQREPSGKISKQFLRLSTKLEPEQLKIYRIFELPGMPLSQKKMKR